MSKVDRQSLLEIDMLKRSKSCSLFESPIGWIGSHTTRENTWMSNYLNTASFFRICSDLISETYDKNINNNDTTRTGVDAVLYAFRLKRNKITV